MNRRRLFWLGWFAGLPVLGAALILTRPSTPPTPAAPPAPPAGVCRLLPGPRPDPACTPGLTEPGITAADLCPHVGPRVVRDVTATTKARVRDAYADHRPGEVDHLIPLELGGSNLPANLWPEDGPIPNPKDRVEDAAHAAVCAGHLDLGVAQRRIAADWTRLAVPTRKG